MDVESFNQNAESLLQRYTNLWNAKFGRTSHIPADVLDDHLVEKSMESLPALPRLNEPRPEKKNIAEISSDFLVCMSTTILHICN